MVSSVDTIRPGGSWRKVLVKEATSGNFTGSAPAKNRASDTMLVISGSNPKMCAL